MTEAEIYQKLTETIEDVIGVDGLVLTPETKAGEVEGWDSLTHLNIMVAVESRFGIRLTTKEMESMSKVGDLVSVIASRTTAPA